MGFKFNAITGKLDKVLSLTSPLQFKGAIDVNTDFPLIIEVQDGWFYIITSVVTDNAGAAYTNTGQTFAVGDEIVWNGTNWSIMGNTLTVTHSNLTDMPSGSNTDHDLRYPTRTDWKQNGIVDRDDSTLAFNDGTRVFTINRTGASFDYFAEGVKYTVTTDDVAGVNTVTLTDTEGLWIIYYDGATLSSILNPSNTQFEDIIETKCLVGSVYYDATNNLGWLGDERHGYQMAPTTHRYLHETRGTTYAEGLALADFVISDGADNEDAQFSIATGEVYDEDLGLTINTVDSTTEIKVFYRDGSDWRWTTQTGFKCITFDGTSATRLAYDNSGVLTEVSDNKFVLVHVFATNAYDGDPISIVGQAEYNSQNEARMAAETEINDLVLGVLPSKEMKPIASVIFQTKDSYANDVNARVIQTQGGEDYVDWRTTSLTSGVTAGDHSSLGGLGNDDHAQYALLDGRSAGQTLIGGTDANDDLTLETTSDATKGDYIFSEMTVAGFLKNNASGVVTGGNLVTAVSRSAQVGTAIDMQGDEIKTYTLTGNTTFTITNPELGRMIILELTGNFTVTLPGTVVVINGDYCPNLGKNYLFLFCNDATTPEYLASWGVTI